MNRRNVVSGLFALSFSRLLFSASTPPNGEATPSRPLRSINIQELGADPTGKVDAAPFFQDAISRLIGTGGQIYVPAGVYRISRTLEITNPMNSRVSGVFFQGDGPQSSILKSDVTSGPLVRVRGVPVKGPIATTFIWGGGLQDLCFDGRGGGSFHDALEVLGWWNASIERVRIIGFSRHGIRAVTDKVINPNPDYTASVLLLRSVQIERCGGWGFIDDGGPQGAPNWSWDRCAFTLCRLGGGFLQSSAHSFSKCAFSACGWSDEKKPAAPEAWGLFFAGSLSSSSRHWVEGCEFDSNLTAHIGVRFLSSSSFVNNRFIFNDRFGIGRLCPAAGVQIGVGDEKAAIRSIEFRQSIFRFDQGGEAVGFDWINSANVRDVEVRGTIFSDNSKNTLALTRYRGNNPDGKGQALGYVIQDHDIDPRGRSAEMPIK